MFCPHHATSQATGLVHITACFCPAAAAAPESCRDTVLDWFTARREMDGLPDNPRAAKQLAATAKRALHPLQPLLPSDMLPQQQQPKQQTPPPAAADAAAGGQQQQKQQQERVRVQSLTAREMAALRSGLPSPRKQKGEKLKQELGVKAGGCCVGWRAAGGGVSSMVAAAAAGRCCGCVCRMPSSRGGRGLQTGAGCHTI
jgi:hypothetical protein